MPPFPSPTKTWHSTAYPSISPLRPELSQKGKTVVISGGGTGIGAGIAHSFAQAGASRIALLGRRPQPLEETKASLEKGFPGIEVFTASVDVSKASEVNDAIEAFVPLDSDNKIDVLISNAGKLGPREKFIDVDPSELLGAINTNISMAFHLAQAFAKRAAKDATVVDINSNAAHVNYGDTFASYTMSKWANYRLWDIVMSLFPNISVFSIQPGVVDTAMNREVDGIASIGYEDHGKLH